MLSSGISRKIKETPNIGLIVSIYSVIQYVLIFIYYIQYIINDNLTIVGGYALDINMQVSNKTTPLRTPGYKSKIPANKTFIWITSGVVTGQNNKQRNSPKSKILSRIKI